MQQVDQEETLVLQGREVLLHQEVLGDRIEEEGREEGRRAGFVALLS
jgi:hypothetical protein